MTNFQKSALAGRRDEYSRSWSAKQVVSGALAAATVGGCRRGGTGGDDPLWDASTQPGPEFEFDQRIAW